MSGPTAPFALFILSDTIGTEDINQVLSKTSEKNDGTFFLIPVFIPDSSRPYDCAPNQETIGEGDEKRDVVPDGTQPPISDSFTSNFAGKSLEDCSKYLRGTPADKAWNSEYFCALGEDDKSEDTVMLVRSFDNGKVHAFPCQTGDTARKIYTAFSDNFEEKLQMYKAVARSKGHQDRSVGEPWEFSI